VPLVRGFGEGTFGAGTFGSLAESYTPVATPARPSWDEALRGLHTVVSRATVLVDGAAVMEIPILDGTVTLDARAATRGRCDLTVAYDEAQSLVPDAPTSLLAPYGNEVKVERGIEYVDGTVELAPLGVFRLEDVDVDDSGADLAIRIAGMDRSKRFIDARIEGPTLQIDAAKLIALGMAGGELHHAILWLLQQAWPAVTTDLATSAIDTAPIVMEEASDRWALAQEIATSMGAELLFDGEGVAVLRPIVQAGGGAPAMELAEGDGGVLLRASRRWTREGTFNRYIATGENTGTDTPPARGVATDENPLSPTYYYGRFGKVPGWYSSPFIVTDAQASDAAQTMLAKQLGTTQEVSFGMVVNPRLAPGDVVRITRERTGIDEDHVIDSITVPLGADGVMTGTTRAVQVYA
jgi:Domain of unknown function (DUF5047)